jgi:hypothetical protein
MEDLMGQNKPISLGLSHVVDPDQLELGILLAYVQLAAMPHQANGERTATLAKFGSVEVRLTELTKLEGTTPHVPPFWLEVYSHSAHSVVDSCGCFEFNEVELDTAADLVWDAGRRVRAVSATHALVEAPPLGSQGEGGFLT